MAVEVEMPDDFLGHVMDEIAGGDGKPLRAHAARRTGPDSLQRMQVNQVALGVLHEGDEAVLANAGFGLHYLAGGRLRTGCLFRAVGAREVHQRASDTGPHPGAFDECACRTGGHRPGR
jgi:hypothetical protein